MIAKLWGRWGAAVRGHGEDHEPELLCMGLYDVSGSMGEPAPDSGSHSKMAELNAVISTLPNEILKDGQAARRVKMGAITFGYTVKVVQSFVPAAAFRPPVFQARGFTPMAEAILRAIKETEEYQALAVKRGLDIYKPRIFMVTDGRATDSAEMLVKARQRIHECDSDERGSKQIAFFAVGVEGADMQQLAWLAKRPPLKLQDFNYAGMFRWLGHSLKQAAHEGPGEHVRTAHPNDFGLTVY
jgi:uncharacterized protein YegL